ncbi:MAG: maleylpyruvate isomerase N-terminal domain-containing protein [Pseudonocardia sp.]|nr:maleylpyruvate isomerase N-terminal domain-containing protein [Pseudonocardia sp.]
MGARRANRATAAELVGAPKYCLRLWNTPLLSSNETGYSASSPRPPTSRFRCPTCPGWTLCNLVTHVGREHRWAAAIVRDRADDDGVSERCGPIGVRAPRSDGGAFG